MARNDRSRIEVYPVPGGFKMQRYDKYGRKAASTDKVFTLRNNTRREARNICAAKNLGTIPIVSVDQVGGEPVARGRTVRTRGLGVAQLAEQQADNLQVGGSNPPTETITVGTPELDGPAPDHHEELYQIPDVPDVEETA